MIAADTSSLVAFLAGEEAGDVDLVISALESEVLVLPPVVVSELLSARNLPPSVKEMILALPRLSMREGFWQRVGEYRGDILTSGKKAGIADTMIAVFCLDHDIPLIERDRDYRHFVQFFGLRLLTS